MGNNSECFYFEEKFHKPNPQTHLKEFNNNPSKDPYHNRTEYQQRRLRKSLNLFSKINTVQNPWQQIQEFE